MNNISLLKESYHLHDPKLKVILSEVKDAEYGKDEIAFSYGVSQSPFGEFFIASCPHGLVQAVFTDGKSSDYINIFREKMECTWMSRDDSMASTLTKRVMEHKEDYELEVCVHGTPFQVAVWSALMDIPFAETITYSELAERVGNPKAVRAVASAVAANRLAYLIPCHRVVHSDGTVGEYRWGGTERKAKMIAWEKKRLEELQEAGLR